MRTRHIAVQCIRFEKSTHTNWLVPMHQDLSIPVAEEVHHPALSGWSLKDGVPHVQPPAEVLREMVAIRLHLDACGPDDGPLRVVPGSHRSGRLSPARLAQLRAQAPEVACVVPQGGAVAMSPLLLHASSRASGTGRRRVLHFVYAPPRLPFGLRWAGGF